jgi:NADP-dependent alcohol dehydrogenase
LEALLCFQNFLSLTTVIQSLPQRQLQNGVVDAYTHVLEQYLTYPHEGHLQDRIAEGILHTLIEVGPKVVEDPTNYELASNMWVVYGLKRFNSKGVPTDWATHMIGHELTAFIWY